MVQPITCGKRKGSKRLARGTLGPWALGVGLLFSWGTWDGANGAAIGVAHKVCLPKDQPRSLMRLLEQGPEVSLLLRSAQVEYRPSWAPPMSWPYSPPAVDLLASVESRIAFQVKTSNSGNGVPKLRRRAEIITLRSAAIGFVDGCCVWDWRSLFRPHKPPPA